MLIILIKCVLKGMSKMNNLVEETRNIMKKYKIKANKSLGQNFLINEEVINNIIRKLEI